MNYFKNFKLIFIITIFLMTYKFSLLTRRFSNHVSRLLSRSHTFAIIVILDLKIHQTMWIHWPFFPKTWTKGHWPLDDLWPHVCWGHMCDSTQGSLCPSPITIHQCMWTQWSILKNTTYIHIHTHTHTYYVQNEWSHSLLLNSVQARQKLHDELMNDECSINLSFSVHDNVTWQIISEWLMKWQIINS